MLLVAAGCGASEAAAPTAAPQAPAKPPPASAEPAVGEVDAGAADAARDASKPEAAPPDRYAGTSFPPPSFEPPHERSAKPGDGQWVAFGSPPARAAGVAPPVIVKSVVHPHAVSRFEWVTLAAMDLARTELHLLAGTQEPVNAEIGAEQRAGVVPESHRKRLLAIINGGFQTRHGHWGVMIDGQVFVKPRAEGCTVALMKDGGVRIASWPAIEPVLGDVRAYRQTPPCLLEDGELHPELLRGHERAWGGLNPKRKTRRRSALGLGPAGRVLFYGLGREVNAQRLAEGLRAAGAVSAVELDINWSWTRFLLVGDGDDGLGITETLVPQMVFGKRMYVQKEAPRDFFYLALRPGEATPSN